MKLISFLLITVLSLSIAATAQDGGEKLVYADFEKVENGRPVTNNGGLVQIFTGHESTPVKFKALANTSPAAPELIVLKDDPQNHLAAFDYNLFGPNQWANVTMEIQGRPLKDGKPLPTT